MRHRFAFAAAVLAVTSLMAVPALAFRPSTKWVMDKVFDKAIGREVKSVKVDATVTVYGDDGRQKGDDLAEHVWLLSGSTPQGGSFQRRETDGVDGAPFVEIRADNKAIVRAGAAPDKTAKAGVDVLADVMAAAPPVDAGFAADRLIGAFKGLGVNVEVVSYARFDGRVAYLIGSKPWETDKPQVWIEKDTYLPMRLVTFQKQPDGSTQKLDLRYLGWGSPVGGAWYPQTVEVWKADKLVRRSATQNVERNVAVDATLFK